MKTIAILDDEDGFAQLLGDLFSMDGYDHVVSGDKAKFLQNISQVNPDIIISDINSPGMHGVDFLKAMKRDPQWQHIPIIICSGLGYGKYSGECMRIGAANYLAKPVDYVDLLFVVTNALNPAGVRPRRKVVGLLCQDEGIRQVTSDILLHSGYWVVVKEDKIEFLKGIESRSLDLVVVDYMSPQMTGLDFLYQVKSNPRTNDLPIIFLSSWPDVSSAVESIKRGAADYVVLPYDAGELLTSVAKALAKWNI